MFPSGISSATNIMPRLNPVAETRYSDVLTCETKSILKFHVHWKYYITLLYNLRFQTRQKFHQFVGIEQLLLII